MLRKFLAQKKRLEIIFFLPPGVFKIGIAENGQYQRSQVRISQVVLVDCLTIRWHYLEKISYWFQLWLYSYVICYQYILNYKCTSFGGPSCKGGKGKWFLPQIASVYITVFIDSVYPLDKRKTCDLLSCYFDEKKRAILFVVLCFS